MVSINNKDFLLQLWRHKHSCYDVMKLLIVDTTLEATLREWQAVSKPCHPEIKTIVYCLLASFGENQNVIQEGSISRPTYA